MTDDGEFLLCQCGEKIQVIETKYGKAVRSLVQEEDEVITFVSGFDDETLVSSHKSGLLRHWNWKGEVYLIDLVFYVYYITFAILPRWKCC